MYENFIELEKECRATLKKLDMAPYERQEYEKDLDQISPLIQRDKALRASMAKIDLLRRNMYFELQDLFQSRKKKMTDMINSPDPSPKMLMGDKARERELMEAIEILQSAESQIEREFEEIKKKLMTGMKLNSDLRRRLELQGEYQKVGRKFLPFGA